MERNRQLAALFREMATLLGSSSEENVMFKIRAYLRAAKVVEELPRDIAEYGDIKVLKELPGIGQAIAEKIMEFTATGSIAALEKLRHGQGDISPELLQVENLGPKRALQIQTELGITTIAGLIEAAKKGKLRTLPRMSELMERKILESAAHATERNKRFPRTEVEKYVEALLSAICAVQGVERAEVAGSYRRKKETVGDIDILTVTVSPVKTSEAVSLLPFVRNVVAHGDTKLSFDLLSGIRVDVRFVRKDQWGSALLYFTGSKEHNIFMRQVAICKGWKLNEYGLFDARGKVVASNEERDVYEALELPYKEPWERN